MRSSIEEAPFPNFELTNVEISLSNSIKYRTNFSLQSSVINMQCGYNTRNKKRWIILTDRYGNTLLSQTFLNIGKVCEMNFNSELLNLDYSLVLLPKNNTKILPDNYDYVNWGDDLAIVFFGHDYLSTVKMDKNLRVVLVGN